MKRKIVTIIIILAVAIVVGIGSVMAYNAVMTNRTGLTLNLDFGNNDGLATPTVYDTSGNGRNAVAQNAQTCNDSYCDFGAGNHMIVSAEVFNTAETSIAIKFSPDFEADDGVLHYFYTTQNNLQYMMGKSAANAIFINMGDTSVASISLATYQAYWKTGEENILVISATTGNINTWLNGTQIQTNGGTAWTPKNPTLLDISGWQGGLLYDGKMYYFKVWNRLLTTDEVATLSADRTKHVQSATRNGLIGHWNMDSNDISGTTVYDKSGNGNNGTMVNTPTTRQTGVIKESILFETANNEYITLPNSDITGITASGALTASAWVKFDSFANNAGIIGLGTAGERQAWIYTVTAGNSIQFITNTGNNNAQLLLSGLSTDTWYFMVWKGSIASGRMTAYMYDQNGTLVATDSDTSFSGTINNNAPNFLGYIDGFDQMDGYLDDVRIYNRALSTAEVTALYNATKINYVTAPPRNGLIGHWNMDTNDINGTTVYDKSGNGNNGTKIGASGTNNTPQSTSGKIKEALNFDGTDDYIDIGDDDRLDLNNSDFTVSTWVNVKGAHGGGLGTVVSKGLNEAYEIFVWDTGVVWFRLTSVTTAISAAGTVSENEWYNIVGTYDGSYQTLYVNGIQKDQDNIGSVSMGINRDLRIGFDNGSNYAFNGTIDEVRIYNRALPTTEITALYNATKINYTK